MRRVLLILIGLGLLISCGSNESHNLSPSFEVLKKNYPILEKYRDSLTNVLTIDYKADAMRFNIFSAPNDLYLLTVEVNGKMSAIPVMPLSDSSYWGYQNSSAKLDTAKNNFKLEYERLLNEVGIGDSSSRFIERPYGVIIQDILGFDPATWQDTIDFLQPCFFYPSYEDSIRLRSAREIYVAQIKKLMHPSPDFYTNCACKSYNGQVFWFDYKRPTKQSKWQLTFKSWIFDCPSLPTVKL